MASKGTIMQEQRLLEKIYCLPSEKIAVVESLVDFLYKRPQKGQRAVGARAQNSWNDRMRKVLAQCQEGAKGYSEEEIENIVSKAVQLVRREERGKQKNH